jgi:hypothetical protein
MIFDFVTDTAAGLIASLCSKRATDSWALVEVHASISRVCGIE